MSKETDNERLARLNEADQCVLFCSKAGVVFVDDHLHQGMLPIASGRVDDLIELLRHEAEGPLKMGDKMILIIRPIFDNRDTMQDCLRAYTFFMESLPVKYPESSLEFAKVINRYTVAQSEAVH